MGAIVMDNCIVQNNSIVAAGAVITQNTIVGLDPFGQEFLLKGKDIDQSNFAGEFA
jgi:carbonic anhydrase/acetyltransferase-like protein (isoleucine patch superfamily)